jgi:hypothetical protein
MKSVCQRDTCIPISIVASFTIAEVWKQPKWVALYEQMKKIWCTCTMEGYSASKKKEGHNADLDNTVLSEIIQVQTDKYRILYIYLTYI